MDGAGRGASIIDLYRSGGSLRIWALGPSFSRRSNDGGLSWSGGAAVPSLDSAATGIGIDHVFALAPFGGGGAAYGFVWPGWLLLREFPEAAYQAEVSRGAEVTFYARSKSRLWRLVPRSGPSGGFTSPSQPLTPSPGSDTDGCVGTTSPPQTTLKEQLPDLAPSMLEVTLEPGERRAVPYEISPGTPSPVDLFFVIDASLSMHQAICGAANSVGEIAQRMVGEGIDAHFGVATYQDHPNHPQKLCYSYRRHRDVSPLDDSFATPLNAITTCGGWEPQMTSLVQAATGSGNLPWIPPGQQASFRYEEGAMPIIVHISDEPLDLPGDPPKTPPVHNTIEQAIEALRARGIRQVGISIQHGTSPALASPWLRRVARETDAVAVSSIDCDGDGIVDIEIGKALVCVPPPASVVGVPMADAITDMVMAIRDDAPVGLEEVNSTGVVASIDPPVHEAVNLKEHPRVPFKVVYRCLPKQAGETFAVQLKANVRGEVADTAEATVHCLDAPVDLPAIPDAPLEAPPVSAVTPPIPPVPPPPPSAPIPVPGPAPAPGTAPAPNAQPQPLPQPQPQPQPNPQSNPNPQANPNVQGALAQQKQQQVQTALAKAAEKVAEQEEYSMSARAHRRTSNLPIAAGGALALGYGCVALAVRHRAQRAEARWH